MYKDKLDDDSLSTHPEIEERLSLHKKNKKELTKNYKSKKPSAEFTKYSVIAKHEMVSTFYQQEEYGASIYKIIWLMRSDKNDKEFLKQWLGYNLKALYDAKKGYKYNRYVDQINTKDQSKTNVQYLNFIRNLSLKDLETFAEYYKEE